MFYMLNGLHSFGVDIIYEGNIVLKIIAIASKQEIYYKQVWNFKTELIVPEH